MKLSLIIPAYNEEKRLEKTALEYHSALNKSKEINDFEIILVSNNCSDSTPKICEALSRKANFVHLDYPYKIGKGGAVLKGFEHARFDYLGFVDADNSTTSKEFLKLLTPFEKKEIGAAIGSRKESGSKLIVKQPIHRRMLGDAFAGVRETLFHLGVKDSQCGAKIFKKNALGKLDNCETGWAFDVDLLYRVKKNGYSIAEVPIEWKDNPTSKVKMFTPIEMFFALLKIRFKN